MPAKKVSATPLIDGSEQVPPEFRELYFDLVCLLDEFCNEHLDTSYQQLCREMAVDLCQKDTPAARGKRASWACGIVYVIGQMNYLGDPDTQPCLRSEEIAKGFGVSTATMHAKARVLRELFDLSPVSMRFVSPEQLASHPMATLVEINGYLVDVRSAPPAVQQYFYEEGFIPCLPSGPPPEEADSAAVRAVNPLTGEVVMIGGSPNQAEDQEDTGSDGRYEVTFQRRNAPRRSEAELLPKNIPAYVLKVTLVGFRPAVWRRLRVVDCTLDELHAVLQIAMGWEDCHLHLFSAGGEKFLPAGCDNDLFDDAQRSDAEVRLSELFEAGHKALEYTYDFGDNWRHKIRIEKRVMLDEEELEFCCLDGELACPPEDVGGPFSYLDLVDGLADPTSEQHQEALDWLGDDFDPEAFDREAINDRLPNPE